MHGTFTPASIEIEPAILYFGTPVVLIGTCNEDGSHNKVGTLRFAHPTNLP